MLTSTYLFGDIICFIVIVILCNQSSRQFKLLVDERYSLEVMLTTALIMLADIIWYLSTSNTSKLFVTINAFMRGLFLFELIFIGYVWLVFIDYKINNRTLERFSKKAFIFFMPMAFMMAVILISHITHWVFYVDEVGTFHRGPLFAVYVFFGLAYIICASGIAIHAAIKTKNAIARSNFFSLASFPVIVFLGAALQIVSPEMPYASVGLTIATLFVYLMVQNKQISIDSLTGINNRRQFNLYIDSLFTGKKSSKKLYILMMDIDKFKDINDTYGHTEGDYALIKVSEILSRMCTKSNDFVARYGGDEFVILCYRHNANEIDALKSSIKGAIEHENDISNKPYSLSLSIGSAEISIETDTPDTAIKKADEQLYLIKSAKSQA